MLFNALYSNSLIACCSQILALGNDVVDTYMIPSMEKLVGPKENSFFGKEVGLIAIYEMLSFYLNCIIYFASLLCGCALLEALRINFISCSASILGVNGSTNTLA